MTAAIDAVFAAMHRDPTHAIPATYHPRDGPDVAGIGVVLARPEERFEGAGGPGAWGARQVLRIRVADVPTVREGDCVTLHPDTANAVRHTVHSPRRPEAHGRRWAVTLGPETAA